MVFWRKKFSNQEIDFFIKQVNKCRSITEDGTVTIQGTFNTLDSLVEILMSLTEFEEETDSLKRAICMSSLMSKDLPNKFNERELVSEIMRQQNAQKIKFKSYRVVFPIWGKPSFLNFITTINKVTINFKPSSTARIYIEIESERKKQTESRDFSSFFDEEKIDKIKKSSICIAHVRANSREDALERASNAVYAILGSVNLAAHGKIHFRRTFNSEGMPPIFSVLIAPHITTHTTHGRITHNGFWHEHWAGGPADRTPSDKEVRINKNYKNIMTAVHKSPWKNDCFISLAKYYQAFSNPNLEESFLDGWRLLERLAGDGSEKAEKLVERASALFEDQTEYRIIAKHLALRRNLISHGKAIKNPDHETIAFQMFQITSAFLGYYLANPFKVKTLHEFWEVLDVDNSREKIDAEICKTEHRLALLKKARAFHG